MKKNAAKITRETKSLIYEAIDELESEKKGPNVYDICAKVAERIERRYVPDIDALDPEDPREKGYATASYQMQRMGINSTSKIINMIETLAAQDAILN